MEMITEGVVEIQCSRLSVPSSSQASNKMRLNVSLIRSGETERKLLAKRKFEQHDTSLDMTVLVDRVRKGDYVLFELVVRGGKLVGTRERLYFSLAGDTLLVKEPVSKWYILKAKVNTPSPDDAPSTGEGGGQSRFRRASLRSAKSASSSLSPWALLCTVSFRDTRERHERKIVRELSQEMACRLPPAVRRKIILERPISQVHEDVIKSIYNIGTNSSSNNNSNNSNGSSGSSSNVSSYNLRGGLGGSGALPQLTRSNTSGVVLGGSQSGALSLPARPSSSSPPPGVQLLDAPEPVYIEFGDMGGDDDRDDSSDDIVVVDDAEGTDYGNGAAAAAEATARVSPFSEFLEMLERFSIVCEEGSRTRSSAIQLATDLTMIGNDFMARAERIGRVIIEELFLPEHQQTLKPIRDRGQLGGLKYIVQDIFFKIGIGEGPPFSADRTVSDPVAGRELSSINVLGNHFFHTKGKSRVSLPLACIVDYRGFRLLASSELPIDNSTLILGSSNAGSKQRQVRQADPMFSALIYECGSSIGLCPHRVVDKETGDEVTTILSVDVEGHRGRDGRYYLVDTSRLMPPTFSREKTTSIFYELFRAEALSRLDVALSSDALSLFVSKKSAESIAMANEHELQIKAATERLLKDVVSDASQHLIKLFGVFGSQLEQWDLVRELHRFGINLRYLGVVSETLRSQGASDLLVVWVGLEAMARALKKQLRHRLRALFRSGLSESHVQLRVATMLDNFFCAPSPPLAPQGDEPWLSVAELSTDLVTLFRFSEASAAAAVKMIHSRPSPALPVARFREKPKEHSVRSFLLTRLTETAGVVIEPLVLDGIRLGVTGFDFRLVSITYLDTNIVPRVKSLPLVERANAFILLQRGMSAGVQDDTQKLGYLVRAHSSVLKALHSNPGSSSLNLVEAEILAHEAQQRVRMKQPAETTRLRAKQAFQNAIQADSGNLRAKCGLAALLLRESNSQAEAEQLFLSALEEDPSHVDALRLYADFLVAQGLPEVADQFLDRRTKIMQGQSKLARQLTMSHERTPGSPNDNK